MFEQNKYKIPLDNFISNNPNFTRTDLENQLSRLGIYTGATPNRSINRDVLKYLRKNLPEFDKKTTKEIRKTKDEPISDDEFARDDFIDRDDGIWYKKLLKTGKTSDPKYKTSMKIEIFTYEKNDKCRFDSLLDAVIKKVPELLTIDEAGYSSTRDNLGESNTYQFESAYLVVESGEGTYFYNGSVELEDTNETPC
jgi:hypothetical protein